MSTTAAAAVGAGAAVVGAGAAVYSAINQPKPPSLPPPPPPASYEQYDEEGNLLTQQVWDADKNAYITKFDPEPPKKSIKYVPNPEWEQWNRKKEDWLAKNADPIRYFPFTGEPILDQDKSEVVLSDKMIQDIGDEPPSTIEGEENTAAWAKWKERQDKRAAEKTLREGIKNKALSALNQTPEDRIKAYDEYVKTFSDAMHRDVDERYEDIVKVKDEEMQAKGMFGSKAYVDTITQMAEDKQKTDVDIAQKATLVKEDMAERDRSWWLRLLQGVESGEKSDTLLGLQKAQTAIQGAQQGTAGLLGAYGASTLNQMKRWEEEMERNSAMTNAFANMAGTAGLAYLYGYKTPYQRNVANYGQAGTDYLYSVPRRQTRG